MPVRCTTFTFAGVRYWRAPDGQIVAQVEGETVERFPSKPPAPPFTQLLPCPWCGVEEDRGHDLLKHVNPNLGTATR